MTVPALTLIHMDTGVVFFHPNDELAFFDWLNRIPCIASVMGEGDLGLVVRLKRRPGQDDLRQMLALCQRYGVDMQQLAKFKTAANEGWFADPKMYWHDAVFGSRSHCSEAC